MYVQKMTANLQKLMVRTGAVDYGECEYGGCDYAYGECDYGGCVSVRVWPMG